MSDNNNAQSAELNIWHRAWPLACIAIAVLNAALIGLLTYELVRPLQPRFALSKSKPRPYRPINLRVSSYSALPISPLAKRSSRMSSAAWPRRTPWS